jgi:zinc-binding alcohol dehydrogenase/oxidoreductase
MKVIVLHEVKNTDSFRIVELPYPQPAAGEATIKLNASALNHRDLWIVKGLYAKIKVPIVLGSDGCGKVVEIGEGVDNGWLGQEVIINPALDWGNDPAVQQDSFRILGMPENGTQAEFVVVPEENLFLKPAHLSFEEAAALPLAGLTGYRALFVQGGLRKGEKVLLTGIGGGVAALMLQMAISTSGEVWVTSSNPQKIEQAMVNGAAGGVNYRQAGWRQELESQLKGKGIDLVVDSAGGDGLTDLIEIVKPGGRIVILGATEGNPSSLNLRRIFWKQIRIQGTTMGNRQDFENMLNFVKKMQIKPLIDSVYEFHQYLQAYRRMEQARQFGKIVLRHDFK